jgi:glycosyltransferase involved in cell wall biosynthesis
MAARFCLEILNLIGKRAYSDKWRVRQLRQRASEIESDKMEGTKMITKFNFDIERARQLRVSIIIPAYNEASVIENCLKSIKRQNMKPFETIIVNNKSTDETLEIVKRFAEQNKEMNIRIAEQNEVQALIPTRNKGFSLAEGDILGRIDADTTLDPDWVKVVKLAFSDSRIQGATGPVRYYDVPFHKFSFAGDKFIRTFLSKHIKKFNFMFGTNMAIRKTAWEKIKTEACIDKEDLLHEDIDLAIHLSQNNLEIGFVPLMSAGMSARRVDNDWKDFRKYMKRFDNTFNAHAMYDKSLYIPKTIFLSIYFPAHLLRKITANK